MSALVGSVSSQGLDWFEPLTVDQAQDDLKIAYALLDRHHPNLGLHVSEQATKRRFDELSAALSEGDEPLSRLEFFRKLLPLITSIRDGHTCLSVTFASLPLVAKDLAAIPLDLVILEDRLFIEADQSLEGKSLKAGTEVVSINGMSVDQILSRANDYTCLDLAGELATFDFVADTLPWADGLAQPETSSYKVEFVLPSGETWTDTYEGSDPLEQYFRSFYKRQSAYDFEIDQGVGLLTVNTFLGEPKKFEQTFDEVFDQLRDQNIDDLIIDLRQNTGGQIGNASLLLAYLLNVKHHFPQYLHITAQTVPKVMPLHRDSLGEGQMDAVRKASNEVQVLYRNWPGKRAVSPRGTAIETQKVSWGKRHYRGQVHVLVSGRTFSAASLFVGELKRNLPTAKFYGATTGGLDNRGCMRAPFDFKLPNSGLLLSVPVMCHIQLLGKKAENFRPDVFDRLSVLDFFNDRDTILINVLKRINTRAPLHPLPKLKPAVLK